MPTSPPRSCSRCTSAARSPSRRRPTRRSPPRRRQPSARLTKSTFNPTGWRWSMQAISPKRNNEDPMLTLLRQLGRPLAAGLAFVALAAAAALPAGVTQGPSIEGITEYRLANGLTVLLFPDASQPKTTVNVTYRVGSAYENYGETGMAHLLEHLVF